MPVQGWHRVTPAIKKGGRGIRLLREGVRCLTAIHPGNEDSASAIRELRESMLTRAGFTVTRSEQESPAPAGRVIRTDPDPGYPLVLPAPVTLIVSTGPAELQDPGAFPDSILRPDTSPSVDTSAVRRP